VLSAVQTHIVTWFSR